MIVYKLRKISTDSYWNDYNKWDVYKYARIYTKKNFIQSSIEYYNRSNPLNKHDLDDIEIVEENYILQSSNIYKIN